MDQAQTKDSARDRPGGRLRVSLLLPGLAALAVACSAPASVPARGPVAEAVRASLEAGEERFDHAAWDRLLAGGTRDGLVDYRFFQRRRGELDGYLERVAAADLARLAPDELKALLINAYNALTVRAILEHPTVSSIREIDGVWTGTRHTVGGHPLTLDEIEHSLLRPFFKDPRIHFAVNCASLSCAPLPGWAYHGAGLEEQLEERSRAFLSDPRQVRVESGILLLSRYFDWYGGDFTAEGWSPRAGSIPAFVARYTREEVASFIADAGGSPPLAFLDYDWSLNAAVLPDAALAGAGTTKASGAGVVTRLRAWITGLGPAGIALYVAAYALLTVLFVPAWPLTVGAGAAYGVVLGTVVVSVSSVLGASLAFLVARYLLRARVARWVEGNARFAAIDAAVGREGWKIVALTRLSPAFPFNLLNYAYGLTAVGFWPYVAASWLAMLPGTLLYVYLGAAGAEVAEAATGRVDWARSTLKWIGLAATVAVTLLITRIARRALRQRAGGESGVEALS